MTNQGCATLAALLAASAMSAALLPGPVAAQNACGAREAVVEQLRARYGESLRGIGLWGGNRIVEIFASEETGTWTITVTAPSGVTCLIASGVHYEATEGAPAGEPL